MDWVVNVLLIVGGLNWGLVGVGMLLGGSAYSWNLVTMIFGFMPWLEAVVYVLVGIAAVVAIVGCKCSSCKTNSCSSCVTEPAKTEGQM